MNALCKKAGIVRCYSREEITTVAGIVQHKALNGPNTGSLTHAGGPAVLFTDAPSNGGMNIPSLKGEKSKKLLENLFPG